MKLPQALTITVCMLLVIIVAGCTDSKTTSQQAATPEKAPTVVQPSPVQTTEQITPSSNSKQSIPSIKAEFNPSTRCVVPMRYIIVQLS